MGYTNELLINCIESMYQRESALNKLLEVEMNMLSLLLDTENQSNDILKVQNKIVGLMACINNSNTLFLDNFESTIYRHHLIRE
ncbi:hypothetical protein [Bacillus cereus group sp. BfR-BA-01331]|uniref:hypothetical protein n=1 Tax=Bacillus cereus group sp. BfR-BA-01331 TaxID=2920307 RepID=UPI001F59175E|nr:hypothetical protein [Bacillus cereus group sp. BfR-BA-01331]